MDRPKVNFEHGSSNFNTPVNVGGTNVILTPAQIFRGLLRSAPEENNTITLTLPSAADLISAFPKVIPSGFCWRFSVRNDGKSLITIEPGKGGSVDGYNTVPVSQYAMKFVLRFSSVTSSAEAYQLISE